MNLVVIQASKNSCEHQNNDIPTCHGLANSPTDITVRTTQHIKQHRPPYSLKFASLK